MSTNPFLDPVSPTNPFMTTTASAAIATSTPCGDPTCKRAHRPNSSDHYSTDAATRMIELQEDGKVGAHFAHMGGQRKKHHKRALEVVAEAAAEHAEGIRQVFIDGIDENNPIGVRMQAAKEFLAVEGKDIERELKERQAEFDNMNKEQLVGSVMEMLQRLGDVRTLTQEVDDIVDADVIDDG